MNSQISGAGEQLENAFQLFNQLSEKLSNSYGGLESHVAKLTQELAAERDERQIQLVEKELLANRLEGLLDALPAGIVVLDAEGYVIQTNPISREMLALQSSDKKTAGQQWKSIAKQAFVITGDELRLKDGRWVTVSACPLGENPGKIILISDVTETHTLQAMLNRQQRLSSLGEMVASLAHQIRTPLASALLYISGMNHPATAADEKLDFAEKAKDRLRHLERMVDDMLLFAKGDVSRSEHIEAEHFIAQLKNFVELDYKSHQITLIVDDSLKGITIRANSDALLSAIQNIIDNAIEACTDEGSEVTEFSEAKIVINTFLNDENKLEINIKDNGCGMSEEIKDRVLEPFYTTRFSGTGLGLAVVNATVNRYDGEMAIVTKQGEGSEFIVKLPRSTVESMLPSKLSDTGEKATYIDKSAKFNKQSMQDKLQIIDLLEGEL